MTPTTRALICATCALTLLACGENNTTVPADDNTSSSNDTTSVELTPSTLFEEFNGVLTTFQCTVAFDCPDVAPELLFVVGRYEDKQSCIDGSGIFGGELEQSELELGVEAGRIVFDAAKARECLDGFKAALQGSECMVEDLESVFGDNEDCEAVFAGQVAQGGGCLVDDDCAGEESFCDTGADASTCFGACGTIPVQMDVKMAGEACEFRDVCVEGFGCLLPSDGSPGTCVAEGSVMDGEECGAGFDADELCASGLMCNGMTSVCEQGPAFMALMDGDTCAPGDPSGYCAAGLACIDVMNGFAGPTGQCGAPVAADGACNFDFECAGGLVCIGANPDPLMGTPGACKAPVAVGEECSSDMQCASGACTVSFPTPGTVGMCIDPSACMLP